MTAVSTVFGMIPLAIGAGDGSEWRNPMSVVSIGGLMASTFLTLLIVPIAYTLVDDGYRALRRGLRALFAARSRRYGYPAADEPPRG
jgi:HAE1 family hydrophobic/amphiphilic exporter-1